MTDLPAYWKRPPASATADLYKKVRDIDFGRTIKRTHLYRRPEAADGSRQAALLEAIQQDELNVAAVMQFCGECDFNFKCTVCKADEEICSGLDEYNLRNLFDPINSTKDLQTLRSMAENVYRELQKCPDMLNKIERITQEQSGSKWWMTFRGGRITASLLKEVGHTTIAKPSLSLVRRICYPENDQFSTPSTRYGKKHEDHAISELFRAVADLHDNITMEKCGLVISNKEPCLGASPDAIFRCNCHGKIAIEVKCPYSARDFEDMISVLTEMKDPYIIKNSNNGEVMLNTNHKYFLQVLTQIHISEANFGYFCVWSPTRLLIFEVQRDEQYWNVYKDRAICFFTNVILPELMAKCYTKN